MAEPLAFICFDPELSQEHYKRFVDEKPASTVAFELGGASMPAQLPAKDWASLVRGNIGRCDLMIVLLGGGETPSRLVEAEIQVARSVNVPFFGVYADGAEAKPALPAGLASNRTIEWDWRRIGEAVQQLSSEGKHHQFK
jgi:hypothetical protein